MEQDPHHHAVIQEEEQASASAPGWLSRAALVRSAMVRVQLGVLTLE